MHIATEDMPWVISIEMKVLKSMSVNARSRSAESPGLLP